MFGVNYDEMKILICRKDKEQKKLHRRKRFLQ